MAYTKQTWTNGVSKLNATRMQHIEDGLEASALVADGAIAKSLVDAKGDLLVGSAADTEARQAVGANNTLVVADSAQTNGIKWAQLTNAMVAAGAAIDYSKLNLASSIVNADISASAAIAVSKLAGAFSTYTPAWTGSSTNPVLNNGTVAGRYLQIGKLVYFTVTLTAGSTTTFGTGTSYSLSLPVTAVSGAIFASSVRLLDTGVKNYIGVAVGGTTTTFSVLLESNALWSPTTPFTFGNTDNIVVGGVYEAA